MTDGKEDFIPWRRARWANYWPIVFLVAVIALMFYWGKAQDKPLAGYHPGDAADFTTSAPAVAPGKYVRFVVDGRPYKMSLSDINRVDPYDTVRVFSESGLKVLWAGPVRAFKAMIVDTVDVGVFALPLGAGKE